MSSCLNSIQTKKQADVSESDVNANSVVVESEGKPPQKIKAAYAEPIDASTVGKFAHLRSYAGQILLGNAFIQVVLAGVSAEVDVNLDWEPAVIAFFEHRQGKWERLSSIASVSFGRIPALGKFYATAVDPVFDRKTATASVEFVYAAAGKRSNNRLVKYELASHANQLSLSFAEQINAHKLKPITDQNWPLKFSFNKGQIIPEAPAKPLGRSFEHFFGNDVIAVVGYQNLRLAANEQNLNVELVNDSASLGWSGIELMVGQKASEEYLFRSMAVEHCAKNVQVKKVIDLTESLSDKARFLQQCIKLQPKESLELVIENDPIEIRDVPYRLMILDKNETSLAYTFQWPNSRSSIPLPRNEVILLKDLATGKIWGKDRPIALGGGEHEVLQIPSRQLGSVEISAKSLDKLNPKISMLLKANLTLARLATNPLSEFIFDSNLSPLSDSVYIIKEWPVELSLAPGQYTFDVFQGNIGRVCSLSVNINPGQVSQTSCSLDEVAATDQHAQSFDLATSFTKEDRKDTLKALAVNGLAKISKDDEVRPRPDTIERLDITDTDLQLTLSLMPFNQELADKWREFKSQHGKQKPIELLAEFAASHAPSSILELACPAESMSNVEYSHFVDKFHPNALQLYGCSRSGDKDLAGLYRELFSSGKKPALLTNISGVTPGWERYHFPRMVMHKTSVSDLDDFASEARLGRYTLSSGSIIELAQANLKNGSLLLDITLRRLNGSYPRVLKVFSENGLIWQKQISFDEENSSQLKETLKLKPHDKYFRLELSGVLEEQKNLPTPQDQAYKLLAATNFLKLSDVPEWRDGTK